MPFRFTNIHMATPVTPVIVDQWAIPTKPSSRAGRTEAPKRPAAASPSTIVRPPPRSSSLRPQQLVAAAPAALSQVKLIPLSVAQKRNDIKYRKEAFEVEERAIHIALMRRALRA